MFDKFDPSILWVSPSGEDGDGTADAPFSAIERALPIVKPGMTIVLKRGVYDRDTTFDICGTLRQPVRLVAEAAATVEIRNACWFFYDVNDLIVSGFTFRSAPGGAISVIGACSRNRFENISFVNCGAGRDTSCTLFFGGSGGGCNVVESCRFERAAVPEGTVRDAAAMSIGLMVSEGDAAGGAPSTDHVFRKNHLVNYDYGILVGAGDAPAGQYGHVVEYNTIEACAVEGILVKCSDTLVRGNRLEQCRNNAIAIGAGAGSVVESNRILDCGHGVTVQGPGHTVANNCIVRCRGEAVRACGASSNPQRPAASNVLVENNTCIDNGHAIKTGEGRVAGVRIDAGATAIVRRNLFLGEGTSVHIPSSQASAGGNRSLLIIENTAAEKCETVPGVAALDIAFKDRAAGDFTNSSGYGASGWVLTPETFDPNVDAVDEANGYRCEHDELDNEEQAGAETGNEESAEGEEENFEGFMGRFYSDKVERNDN
jgi:hypothetical protein